MYTFCRLDGLAVGAAIALAMRDPLDSIFLKRWGLPIASTAGAGVAAVVMLTGQVFHMYFWMGTFGITFFSIFLSMTKLRILAETSLGKNGAFVAVHGLVIAICVTIAYASWHLFESKILRFKDRPLFQYQLPG